MTDAAWQAIIALGTAAITGIFGLSYRWLRAWSWDRHEARQAAHIEALEKSTPSSRPDLEKHAPQPPPDLGPIILLIGAISGAAGAGYVGTQFAADTFRTAAEAAACPKRCPNGEECHNGVCGKLARPPAPDKPSSPPESAAIFTSTPAFYRRSPFERDE
jgi:hypothetical protein